jgi:hypothetical protein
LSESISFPVAFFGFLSIFTASHFSGSSFTAPSAEKPSSWACWRWEGCVRDACGLQCHWQPSWSTPVAA